MTSKSKPALFLHLQQHTVTLGARVLRGRSKTHDTCLDCIVLIGDRDLDLDRIRYGPLLYRLTLLGREVDEQLGHSRERNYVIDRHMPDDALRHRRIERISGI